MPQAILIAGPNGAGKTTLARQFLPVLHPGAFFLNVDEIQHESRRWRHPMAAGKELIKRLGEAEKNRLEFAVETTLSSQMYNRRLDHWKGLGYRVILHFIELPSEDFAVRRVAQRVAEGGHSVPEPDIRRRFQRGLHLFHRSYKPAVHQCYHWFSDENGLRLKSYEKD